MFNFLDFFFYIFIFVCGGLIGSFLNVVIDRLPRGQSVIYPPSHCPRCRHRLGFYDLIPFVSFFYLRGKCRYCRAKISSYYPLIEFVTGLLFVLTIFIGMYQSLFYIIYLLFVISSLIIVFFTDLKYGIIPFKVVVISLIIITTRYFFIVLGDPGYVFNYFLSGIGIFTIFLLLFLITKGRGMGFGDVVFSFFMGYILGFPNIILGVYIAFLTGALVSLILVIMKKKRFKGGMIAFGPFLVLGTIISMFWGQSILDRLFLYFHVF